MARMRSISDRAEQVLGLAVVATAPVAGGSVCTSTRLRLGNGSSALIKTRPHAPADFFRAEATGLQWLAAAEAIAVPRVLAVEDDCLVISWIDPVRPTPEHAAELGRRLAALHDAGAPAYGAPADGYIGTLPLPNAGAPTWPEFYAVRRVLPYLKLAVDRERIAPDDAEAVEQVVRHVVELGGPEEPPARLHGDLWSGNVVWHAEQGPVLIDPAAHGGHRESDLAMLTLFGVPHLARVLAGYEEAHPLPDGWQQRQSLHQLFPLLVHAALFGRGYGASAGEAARRALAA